MKSEGGTKVPGIGERLQKPSAKADGNGGIILRTGETDGNGGIILRTGETDGNGGIILRTGETDGNGGIFYSGFSYRWLQPTVWRHSLRFGL